MYTNIVNINYKSFFNGDNTKDEMAENFKLKILNEFSDMKREDIITTFHVSNEADESLVNKGKYELSCTKVNFNDETKICSITVELKIHLDDDQPVWLSYHERKILDAFDLQIEKMLVIQDITANKKLEKQKEQVACTDFLTGLSNRRGMLRSMANDISGLTVIMIDIDDFKSINDSFGHRIGDEVLKEVATAIKKVFLADVLVRYGGDEFLIITRLHERDVIGAKIEKLMSRLKEITYGNEESQKRGVSISAGVSAKAKTGRHTIENLIEMSDEAMYHIKKHGKQGYSFYDERTKDK